MSAGLIQKHGEVKRIVETGSKNFSERERFAIVNIVEKFEYFLHGKPFVLLTDYKALTAIDRNIFANNKLKRWQDRPSEYNFVVRYILGEDNVIPDIVCRPFSTTISASNQNDAVSGKYYKIDHVGTVDDEIHV